MGVPMGNADAAYASARNTIWTWCTSEGTTKKGGGVCSWVFASISVVDPGSLRVAGRMVRIDLQPQNIQF